MKIKSLIKQNMPLWAEKMYIKWLYKKVTNKKCNLHNPRTYTEKVQWCKLYRNNELITELSDKLRVRDWVKEKIGEEYLIPIIDGPYDSSEKIRFDA